LMMGCGVMFGEIISPIGDPGFPVDVELALVGAITKPIEAHVHGFRSLLFDHVIDNPAGSVVVSLQGRGRLGMAKVFQRCADGADGLGIEEEGAPFRLSSTGDNLTHDLTEDVDRTIIWWCWVSGCGRGAGAGAEEGVPSGA